MKKVWSMGLVMMLVTLLMSGFAPYSTKAQGSVSLQVFYDELQPYGTWMQHARFGYVWMPRVERGFTPYATNGYWINTEYGNTWVSDYSWGWAPFHYGRWFYDDFNGWIWIPDTEWAPAWVAWRGGGGYYGWAPLMPGFGISVSVNYYHRIPHHYWNFVPNRYITYRTVHHHCVPRTQVVNIINNTTVITHNYTDNSRGTYFTGPSRHDMERTGRTRVDVYRIEERTRPGRADIDRGTVSLYKPQIDNSRETRSRAMPSRYMKQTGNGRMEEVESRQGKPSEFGREQNAGKSWTNPGNTMRQDSRTNDSKPLGDMPNRNAGSDDWKRSSQQPDRSQDIRHENKSRYTRSNDLNREGMSQEQRRYEPQQSGTRFEKGTEVQRNQSYQRERGHSDPNTMRKVPSQESQRMQVERQQPNYQRNSSGRESQSYQPQRSVQSNPRSSVERTEQIQRSSGQSRSYQSNRSTGTSRERGSNKRD